VRLAPQRSWEHDVRFRLWPLIMRKNFLGISHRVSYPLCNSERLSDTPKAKLIAVFEPGEEGGYHAFIPAIPGIHTQGETLDEARENLADAIGQWLADELDDTLSNVPPTDRVEVDLIEKVLLKRETTRA